MVLPSLLVTWETLTFPEVSTQTVIRVAALILPGCGCESPGVCPELGLPIQVTFHELREQGTVWMRVGRGLWEAEALRSQAFQRSPRPS